MLGDEAAAEPVLCAWGIDTDGRPHLVGLAASASESAQSWRGFLEGLTTRGLADPLLVVSDGAPGLIAAIEHIFLRSLRQRCVIHRLRNARSPRCPRRTRTPSRPTGGPSSTGSTSRRAIRCSLRLAGASTASAPSGSARTPLQSPASSGDFESLTVHLRFPSEHWKRCRHTNLIERTFGETRRRTKVMGRLTGERTCVAFVFAVLDRQSRGWRGMTMTPCALRRLQICAVSSSVGRS